MARKPRYHISGAFYHIMLRGNNGQNIFLNDADRCRLCLLLQQGVERYGHRIHAFCLMTNHIHLLVQLGHMTMSKIVHNLAFRYSQYFNRRYRKKGHLFQGRFKAILLDENEYFLKLIRYIHTNPVRAKLVKEPQDYNWSGHNVYAGKDDITWLTVEPALAKFDQALDRAQRLYCDYVLKRESKEELDLIGRDFKDGQVLGSDDFMERIKASCGQTTAITIPASIIIEAACEVFGIEKEVLASVCQSRNLSLARGAIITCALEKGKTLQELAIIFNRDGSTLSSLRKRFLLKYQESHDLREQLEKVKEKAAQLADLQA